MTGEKRNARLITVVVIVTFFVIGFLAAYFTAKDILQFVSR